MTEQPRGPVAAYGTYQEAGRAVGRLPEQRG
ncbi:hypothetical protein QO019_001854 [Streptomyces thermodiastaticus]|uniref:Uncharacterized protein n=1 Tax=Streptomyces thermodiastaticus TaxID=44061 RepID=A0ABU0KCA7_9ACTN|nr:hypothetical protein [Streptomyces thermodiastaticus]